MCKRDILPFTYPLVCKCDILPCTYPLVCTRDICYPLHSGDPDDHPPRCGRWYAPLPRHLRSLLVWGDSSSCGRLWCCPCRVVCFVVVALFLSCRVLWCSCCVFVCVICFSSYNVWFTPNLLGLTPSPPAVSPIYLELTRVGITVTSILNLLSVAADRFLFI